MTAASVALVLEVEFQALYQELFVVNDQDLHAFSPFVSINKVPIQIPPLPRRVRARKRE